MNRIIGITGYVLFGLVLLLYLAAIFDDGTEDLGGGYRYTFDSAKNIIGPQITIPPQIMGYKYDKRFIIVNQRLNGQWPERIYSDEHDYNYPSRYGDYYWIIDKQEDTFYGPLSKQTFMQKSDSLNVKLKLSE